MNSLNDTTIEMKDISIEFPGVKALQNVNCVFKSGHVKALMGANGAGKSTLMKVLSGVNSNYTGDIFINGEKVEIRSPADAKRYGIEIVYQEVDTVLSSTLTVGENVMMDYLVYGLKHKQLVNWNYLHKKASEILTQLNMPIRTKSLVSTLSLSQKQMVVIARAMLGNCKFLILDEPTAPLSNNETQKLFELVRQLQKEGVGVIFISHRLNELFEICESISVLRDGRLVGDFEIDETTTIKSAVELMLGKTYNETVEKGNREISQTLLEVKGLSDSEDRIHDIDLYVRKGEIIGVFGLVGAGKTELCKTMFGAYGKPKGTMSINGKPMVIKNPAVAVQCGMAYIPEERRKEGVILNDAVYSNLSVATLHKFTNALSFVNKKKERESAQKKVDDLHIKTPSLYQKVAYLSGGNQQKITIGKWLDSGADVYIFDEPTKGIDVGAKAEIYKLIVELAREGKGIIYASSEQTEILNLTDRTYIMYDGRIQKEFETAQADEEKLLFYSTGGNNSESIQ